MTEIQKYRVLESKSGFEIRDYEPHILLTTLETGSLSSAGNRAFSRLAAFIFGENQKSQKIAMTAPVLEQPSSDGYSVSFVMPADMRLEDMPAPNPPLRIEQKPGGKFAAIEFSGLASEALFKKKDLALKSKLSKLGIGFVDSPIYARYDGPWKPGFLRRNEVLVPLS